MVLGLEGDYTLAAPRISDIDHQGTCLLGPTAGNPTMHIVLVVTGMRRFGVTRRNASAIV